MAVNGYREASAGVRCHHMMHTRACFASCKGRGLILMKGPRGSILSKAYQWG